MTSPPAPPAPPPPSTPSGPHAAPPADRPGAKARPLPHPFVALVGYTLRACLPARRWSGILLPCLGAVLFGWLATLEDANPGRAFEDVAELGLFGLVLPLTCLIIGDAVLGADLRAGTFGFTWLSPVPFPVIVVARWFGGWLVALVTLVPALVLATVVADVPGDVMPVQVGDARGEIELVQEPAAVGEQRAAMAIAAAAGSAA
jgi:hypothetical protein